jgi:hypothetical protein
MDAPNSEPSRTENCEPKRAKLLSDSDEPREEISMTDREKRDPNLATPKTDKLHPSRAIVRSENEAPT